MNVPTVAQVVAWLDTYLDPTRREDYGPNGLQVDASPRGNLDEIPCARIVTGVTANLAFLERAAHADLAVVHHGLYWTGAPATATGPLGRRLAWCMRHGLSVAAYHLPLDAHPEVGNAAALARSIGLTELEGAFLSRGAPVGIKGTFPTPVSPQEFRALCLGISDRAILFEGGPSEIRTVGIVTGGAPRLASEAASVGLDAFISGELTEFSQAIAAEERIHVAGCGHHRTEVFGPRALAAKLALEFPTIHVTFLDVDNLA
jgi:dinuclear metal center YbgI/SA1388 family protein